MKKIIITAILFVSIFGLALNDAHAYTYLGGKHKTKNITYRINTLESKYHSSLKSAFSAWDSATTLTFGPQVGTNRAQIVVNGKDYGKTGWNAQNYNYRDWIIGGDYVDSIIDANYYYMSGMVDSKRQGVFGHEIGHSLGLDHVKDTKQIMCTAADGRSVNKPGNDDIAGVEALYK
jgi:predicted Zn-dependent protease